MGILSKALPRDQRQSEPTVHSGRGMYNGFFTGMSEPFTWTSEWANDKCRVCRGTGKGRADKDDEKCFLCGGHGRKTDQRVTLSYELENGIVETEEVSFKLTEAGTSRDGQPLSPSTLFVRLRSLSGLRNPKPAELDEWFSSLPTPIRVPCSVVINDNKSQTALKITDVLGWSAQNGQANGQKKPACPQDVIDKARQVGWTGEQLRDEWIAAGRDYAAVRTILDRLIADRQAFDGASFGDEPLDDEIPF
jgi:hypothetical protein